MSTIPLMVAAFAGQTQAVKLLAGAGADIHATHVADRRRSFNALDVALAKGHHQVAEFLSSKGVVPTPGELPGQEA